MKRPIFSIGFLGRFAAYAAIGSALAAAVVFGAYWIHPAFGEACGKWALIVALVAAWQTARVLPEQDRQELAEQNVASLEPPDSRKFYYRHGKGGDIQGPESLEVIQALPSCGGEVELVEANGQSFWALTRATWKKIGAFDE